MPSSPLPSTPSTPTRDHSIRYSHRTSHQSMPLPLTLTLPSPLFKLLVTLRVTSLITTLIGLCLVMALTLRGSPNLFSYIAFIFTLLINTLDLPRLLLRKPRFRPSLLLVQDLLCLAFLVAALITLIQAEKQQSWRHYPVVDKASDITGTTAGAGEERDVQDGIIEGRGLGGAWDGMRERDVGRGVLGCVGIATLLHIALVLLDMRPAFDVRERGRLWAGRTR